MRSPLSPEQAALIRALVQEGSVIQAVKEFREATGSGLAEAKAAVDQIRDSLAKGTHDLPHLERAHIADDGRLSEVRAALATGNKIGAIKLYREVAGVGLKEAKDAVEAMDVGPSSMSLPLPNPPQSNAPLPTNTAMKSGCFGSIIAVAVPFAIALGAFLAGS
jgi:ribosomal protein L7/L12